MTRPWRLPEIRILVTELATGGRIGQLARRLAPKPSPSVRAEARHPGSPGADGQRASWRGCGGGGTVAGVDGAGVEAVAVGDQGEALDRAGGG